MAQSSEKKLFDLLDRKAFQPVLNASPEDYSSESKKDKLEDVQRATESERERYQHYGSAKKIRDNFHHDLSSDAAKKVHRELRDLELPALPDVRDEFDRRCEELSVSR